jgi:hypothetical protein
MTFSKPQTIATHALLSLSVLLAGCGGDAAKPSTQNADAIYTLPAGVETRWASRENPTAAKGAGGKENGGRKGAPSFPLKAGETQTLAEANGTSGVVRRIWATVSDRTPRMLRGLQLDFYWDGAKKPAVSVPFGDFFGMSLGRTSAFESEYFSSPEGKSFNCCVPMPFRTGMKITITNASGTNLPLFFYDVDFTVGDSLGDDALYFHAYFHRENPTSLQKDFEILPKISGKGRYLGATFGVIANMKQYFNSWWGEGECKAFIDGDRENPTLCGTGTEDYIGTGWFLGAYANRYQGCLVSDKERMNFSFYRLHVPDPVYFHKDIRVTMQQIGCWTPESKPNMVKSGNQYSLANPGKAPVDWNKGDGLKDYGLFERQDDWSCCAYFYLDKPENNLPPLQSAAERTAGLF